MQGRITAKGWEWGKWVTRVLLAGAIFGLGFDLFLEPVNINCGGVSGIGMLFKELLHRDTVLGIGMVALVSLLINIPLFFLGFRGLGRRFFVGSVLGSVAVTVFMQLFLPLEGVLAATQDRLLNAVFGGVCIGLALGIAIGAGASTGGSDIAARLLKLRFKNLPIGQLLLLIDVVVVLLNGIVYRDILGVLYSSVTLFVSSATIDAVVYKFDYSKVALIITDCHETVASAIDTQLGRGITLLPAKGYYRKQEKYVVLTVVKRQQLAELEELVAQIDARAFIIIQEAHQVYGDGFRRYDKHSL